MRNDVRIDKRLVECKHLLTTMGFDKWRASVGDIIIFKDGDVKRMGRMIGRIHYAPALGDRSSIHNFILVVALDELMTHLSERWVNPVDVLRIQSVREQREVCDAFFSDVMVKTPIETVRYAASHLWSSVTAFLAYRRKIGQ